MNYNEMMKLSDINWAILPKELSSGYLVQDFNVNKLKDIKIDVCGLGFFKLYINGALVSKERTTPVWSNYEKRELDKTKCSCYDEVETNRIYYKSYNITKYLHKGINRIGVVLGNGWYRQSLVQREGNMEYGNALKCGFIIYDKSSVITSTNSDMFYKQNDIIFNNIYFGEKHDFSLLDKNWTKPNYLNGFNKCKKIDAPKSILKLQKCPDDMEIRSITPILIKEEGNIKIYDVGENISGYVMIKSTSDKVVVHYAEEYCADKKYSFISNPKENAKGKIVTETKTIDIPGIGLNYMHTGEDVDQSDEYINTKIGQMLTPTFGVYGFRYFTVEGGDALKVKVVHSKLERKTTFECNDPILNWEYNAYIRTQLNNMHNGVPSDCPHRERLGYTGDGQLTSECSMMSFLAKEFYEKWIQDILDSQDINTGHIPHTAPFYGGGGGPGGWGSAIVTVPYNYYKIYGDKAMLKKCLPYMLKWLDYMESASENGLVVKEKENGWCLGDWLTPAKNNIPCDLVNTYYYAKSLEKVAAISSILNDLDLDIKILSKLEYVLNALKNKYVKNGKPLVHQQGAESFLIDLGLCDYKSLEELNRYYENSKTIDTGVFGFDVLLDLLCLNGYYKTVYDLLHSEGYPSFIYEMKNNSTTLWEGFDGTGSRNHPMWGSYVKYFYRYFAGLNYERKDNGKLFINIDPKVCKSMLPLKVNFKTEDGYLYIKYIEKNNKVIARVRSENISISKTRVFDFAF